MRNKISSTLAKASAIKRRLTTRCRMLVGEQSRGGAHLVVGGHELEGGDAEHVTDEARIGRLPDPDRDLLPVLCAWDSLNE